MTSVEEQIRQSEDVAPRVLPPQWECLPYMIGGLTFRQKQNGLGVILRVEEHGGARWLHVSCSFVDRLPTWDHLRAVKDLFVGRDRKAISVLPCEAEYVNAHPFCLHLWSPLERDPLPDFRRGGSV